MVKNPPANARDSGLIPGLGRSAGEGNGNPLQYSCLGNPVDRETWWATVYKVVRESDTNGHIHTEACLWSSLKCTKFQNKNSKLGHTKQKSNSNVLIFVFQRGKRKSKVYSKCDNKEHFL